MKGKVFKTTVWVIVALLLLLTAVSFGAGAYMVSYGLTPEVKRDMDSLKLSNCGRYPGLVDWVDSLERAGIMRDTATIDADGHEVHAYFAAADENKGRSAVIIHGYTSNPMSMMMLARMYRDDFGYNVLLPHLNYHAESEGDHIQMGWFDRFDIEDIWIPMAHQLFSDTLQVIHGISMGGATTMMVSGDVLPDYVRGFVEDCGYSSVWDEFAPQLKEQFGLPSFPILNCASLICRMKYGWGFKEASSAKQVAKCELPMLFIHGDADTYVPADQIYTNFEAKQKGYREMWMPEGTEHANAFLDYPEEYTARVGRFLKEQVEQ